MTTLEETWPLFALHVRSGSLEMHPVRDRDLAELIDVALSGVHDPATMPFYTPWTDAPADELPRNFAQYHWRTRVEFAPERWALDLAVRWEGRLVGAQGVSTRDFLVTRTGETGSWLGRGSQGRGIGTAMRQAMCVLCFDHLGFTEITSAAFVDNPQSLAVSRKVGYQANGEVRMKRRQDDLAINRRLVLTPEAFIRPREAFEVEGIEGVRRLIGLDT